MDYDMTTAVLEGLAGAATMAVMLALFGWDDVSVAEALIVGTVTFVSWRIVRHARRRTE